MTIRITKTILQCSVVILLIGSMLWAWAYLHKASTDPIRHVEVVGQLQHVERENVISKAMPYVHRGFFAVDIFALRDSVQNIPWVKDVAITRIWPDTIRIDVTEKQAVARWMTRDLITADGQVFTPEHPPVMKDLPFLLGPKEHAKSVLNHYVEMQSMLGPYHLVISEVHFTARQAWWIRLDSGMVLMLGRDDPLAALTRFTKSYESVFGANVNDAERVDLRYPSGIAVKWRHNLETRGA